MYVRSTDKERWLNYWSMAEVSPELSYILQSRYCSAVVDKNIERKINRRENVLCPEEHARNILI